jgi:hypothetical protein
MANIAVSQKQDQPVRLLRGSRAGLRLICFTFLVGALFLSPGLSWAGKISLTLSGGISFPDQSPDTVPVIGPETVTLEVKVVGQSGIPWTLTLIANSDFQSGPDVIPIGVVSWTAFPDPPYQGGTLSVVVPAVIASGLTHDRDNVTFDFVMQNSWTYDAGNYSSTATFTLTSP